MMTTKKDKTIMNPLPHCVILVLSLNAMCILVGLPAHAQQVISRRVSHRIVPISLAARKAVIDSFHLACHAAASLHAGNYTRSESEARQAVSLDSLDGVGEEVLAESLNAQSKDQAALEQYQTVAQHYDCQPRNLLPYAMLLLKSGQWAQAVAMYNQVLPHLPDVGSHPEIPTLHDGDVIRANSHFSPDVPEPAALATAIHIARGMVYNATTGWAGDSLDKEAMEEYAKALQSAPDNALANYYYGVGWQKLSLSERAQFGTIQQVKAALQKAGKIGTAEVRAAERASKNAG